jgi:hypothetical protein
VSDDIATLAARVRWLDQHRRTIRVSIAIAVVVTGVFLLPGWTGWPRIPAWMLGVALGIALAFAVDVVVAALSSLWEMRHDLLVRDRGLPRAVLRRGRK